MRSLLLAVVLLAGACGRVAELRPPAGHSLAVRPAMARVTPTAADLLRPPPYTRPQRVDELMTKSAPREADPFDLPPASGGAAPDLPAGIDPTPANNQTGPAEPQ